jgi:hypothetical protein
LDRQPQEALARLAHPLAVIILCKGYVPILCGSVPFGHFVPGKADHVSYQDFRLWGQRSCLPSFHPGDQVNGLEASMSAGGAQTGDVPGIGPPP